MEPAAKIRIARRNTLRAPKRSAAQPDAGMNTASASRYEVSASFRWIGSAPRSAAICGSEVAITVPSMFSISSAVATISGTVRRDSRLGIRSEGG